MIGSEKQKQGSNYYVLNQGRRLGLRVPTGDYTTRPEKRGKSSLSNLFMGEATQAPGRELTYGEKAVGITFNPGGNPAVDSVKKLYADVIDSLMALPVNTTSSERSALIEKAIREAQTAQMWAVKAITFQF